MSAVRGIRLFGPCVRGESLDDLALPVLAPRNLPEMYARQGLPGLSMSFPIQDGDRVKVPGFDGLHRVTTSHVSARVYVNGLGWTDRKTIEGWERITKVPSSPSSMRAKQDAALLWLSERPKLWRDRVVSRFDPMAVSVDWKEIAQGLKAAGIYSEKTNDWDLRLEVLVERAKALDARRPRR